MTVLVVAIAAVDGLAERGRGRLDAVHEARPVQLRDLVVRVALPLARELEVEVAAAERLEERGQRLEHVARLPHVDEGQQRADAFDNNNNNTSNCNNNSSNNIMIKHIVLLLNNVKL